LISVWRAIGPNSTSNKIANLSGMSNLHPEPRNYFQVYLSKNLKESSHLFLGKVKFFAVWDFSKRITGISLFLQSILISWSPTLWYTCDRVP
jgi:hypothetical protein